MRNRTTFGFLAVAILSAVPCFAATLPPAPPPLETYDSGTLHVQRFGNGSPVMLLPGLASGTWTWNGVVPHLALTHTVYAIGIAGFAGQAPASGEVSFPHFVDELDALMQKAHLDKVAIVGHSLGGTLAIAYAEARPQRVSNLVAVDGLPVFPTLAGAGPAQRASVAAQVGDQVHDENPAEFAVYERNFFSTVGVSDAALAAQLAELSGKSDPRTVGNWLEADLNADLRPQLAAITAPFTEITGWSSGEPYSQAQKTAFYQSLLVGAPDAQVVVIPNARHFVMLDQPAAFGAALDRALER